MACGDRSAYRRLPQLVACERPARSPGEWNEGTCPPLRGRNAIPRFCVALVRCYEREQEACGGTGDRCETGRGDHPLAERSPRRPSDGIAALRDRVELRRP